MGGFESLIAELWESVGTLQERHETREFCSPGSAEALVDGLCVNVGPGANTGIILRDDTFVELGNPIAGSAAMVLWSDDSSLVVDGRITLVGPDVPESEGESLPFGQVLLVHERHGRENPASVHSEGGQPGFVDPDQGVEQVEEDRPLAVQ